MFRLQIYYNFLINANSWTLFYYNDLLEVNVIMDPNIIYSNICVCFCKKEDFSLFLCVNKKFASSS